MAVTLIAASLHILLRICDVKLSCSIRVVSIFTCFHICSRCHLAHYYVVSVTLIVAKRKSIIHYLNTNLLITDFFSIGPFFGRGSIAKKYTLLLFCL